MPHGPAGRQALLPAAAALTLATLATRCRAGGMLPPGLMDEVKEAVAAIEAKMGKRFADAANPLLFSVRSGAAVGGARWRWRWGAPLRRRRRRRPARPPASLYVGAAISRACP